MNCMLPPSDPSRFHPVAQSSYLKRVGVISLTVLFIGVLCTCLATYNYYKEIREKAAIKFDRMSERLATEAQLSIQRPMYGLEVARAITLAKDTLLRAEFRLSMLNYELDHYAPGVLGFGFIQRVTRDDLATFLASQRADQAPDFTVHPVDPLEAKSVHAEDMYIIKFMEPLEPNSELVGFDMGSDATQRAAIESAVATGRPTISNRVTLSYDGKSTLGVFFIMPVFESGVHPTSPQQRYESLAGLVFAPMKLDETFGALASLKEGLLDLEVYEGDETSSSARLFDHDSSIDCTNNSPDSSRADTMEFAHRRTLHVGERTWTLLTAAKPTFEAGIQYTTPLVLCMCGTLLSVLLAAIVWVMGSSRASALQIAHEITAELRANEQAAQVAAHTDHLTGLANRTQFHEWLEQSLDWSRANPHTKSTVLFMDFDRFKQINDSLGHNVGDAVLREIASRLRKALQLSSTNSNESKSIFAARLGGDEFVALIKDTETTESVASITSRLIEAFSHSFRIEGHDIFTTVSIGSSTISSLTKDPDEALCHADIAMYEAKLAGRGRHVPYLPSMGEQTRSRQAIETDLRSALDQGQFFLTYQPILSLESGEVDSLEALIRWQHPTRGLVRPDQFIPIAEQTGLIIPIGEWVLYEACRQFADWQRQLGSAAPRSISVNLSRDQLSQSDIVWTIRDALRRANLSPSCLHLEVTESAVMKDVASATKLLSDIREIGITLCLDDFGTGYSSLACLHQFPIDILKIDKSFVANTSRSRDFVAVLDATIQLANNLGMRVVAEGIETTDQIAVLQFMGCQFGQGYHFSKPLPADKVPAFLQFLAGNNGLQAAA